MLVHLDIKNFTIIDALELDFEKGMTVLTGETGAGKSIIVDALEQILGTRAKSNDVKEGAQRCDIHASFDLSQIKLAQQWLVEHELDSDNECIIRRSINCDGRSKSYVNGRPITMQSLRELGQLLVNIHGQHEPQKLLKKELQRQVLDAYVGHQDLVQEVSALYQEWRKLKQELVALQDKDRDRGSRCEFLRFQIQELEEVELSQEALEKIEKEHKHLANADQLLQTCQSALQLLSQDEQTAVQGLLHNAKQQLSELVSLDSDIKAIIALLESADIQVQEACNEVQSYLDRTDLNPQRLSEIEVQLSKLHDLARKYQVNMKELPAYLADLQKELHSLESFDEEVESLKVKVEQTKQTYFEKAKKLSDNRKKSAKKLAPLVTKSIRELGLEGGKFDVSFEANDSDEPAPHGLEKLEFMVSTNPGRELQPLNKVVSGGELSRISLAIQVITWKNGGAPTLIFDEVDTGVGGATAEIVGKLLHVLGEKAQVLCVTHLAQVAAQGHQHIKVEKTSEKKSTQTNVFLLNEEERVQELARMLGGVKITKQSLAHAQEMLEL